MPLSQKAQNAKPAKVSQWTMKNQGLQPGDKLPSRKCRMRRYPPLTKEQQKLVEEITKTIPEKRSQERHKGG